MCKRYIDQLPLALPLLDTQLATQACTLIGNQTGNLISQASTQSTGLYQPGPAQFFIVMQTHLIYNHFLSLAYIFSFHLEFLPFYYQTDKIRWTHLPLPLSLCCFFFKTLFIYFWREGKGGRNRRKETLARNPGMGPDQELNQRPFILQAGAQSTELHQPGHLSLCFLT